MRLVCYSILLLFCLNSPALAGNDETIISLCKEGIELYQKNQWQEALQRFQQAVKIPQETPKPDECMKDNQYYVGMIYYRLGKDYYGKAREYLDSYPVATGFYQPGMMNVLVAQGNMFWEEGNYIKAIERYEEAFRDYPSLPEIPGIKAKIVQMALAPAATRPQVEVARPLYDKLDLCRDKKPDRYFRFAGKDGEVNELCTTINGKAVEGISLEIYVEDENGNLVGSMYKENSELTVYLVKGEKRTPVLETSGHQLTFVPNPKKELPDIQVAWETHTEEMKYLPQAGLSESHDFKTVFTWTGMKYEDVEFNKALQLNKEALTLWKRGKIAPAITKWRQGLGVARRPGYGLTALTEMVNNYGFALGQEEDEESNAKWYLTYVTKADPNRWQAYLNLGDLYWSWSKKEKAIGYYIKTLILSPEYRDRETLRQRITSSAASGVKPKDKTIVHLVIHKFLPEFTFRIKKSKDDAFAESIDVIFPSGKKIQSIPFPEDVDTPCESCKLLEFMDLNFDGYKDLLILIAWGSGGSMYEVWTYSPEKKTFKKQPFKNEFANPSLDWENEMLVTSSPMGCCAGTHYYYRYRKGKFRLVKQEDYFMENNREVFVVRELVRGKWKVSKKYGDYRE